jgi:hypothetical protein
MVNPVQPVNPASASAVSGNEAADQNPNQPVSADRMDRFRSAMIAAALRQPMLSLAGANGEPEDDHDPPPIPMKAPILIPPEQK